VTGTAVLLLYFGAANAWLSRYAGTCTQNTADQLGGLGLVLICYTLALGLLWRARPGLVAGGLMVALLPVLIWHAWEGARFAFGVLVQGQSACTMLVGYEYGMDGREITFAVLWLLAAWAVPGLILWRLLRNRRRLA
jgi:hypothetical protein